MQILARLRVKRELPEVQRVRKKEKGHTMNYYEAKKMGTAGPIRAYRPAYHTDPDSRALVQGEDNTGCHVATWIKKDDAALLAHKWNHFDKLLEALKAKCEDGNRDTPDVWGQMEDAIQAAEEVEGL